jgi:Plasmid pRiA4b ORF-3-like protein
MNAYTFRARLVGWPGVSRTVAVRGDQTLVDLHRVLQAAFEWGDDHLYSFWLTGRFWGDVASEYSTPGWCEQGQRSARTRLEGLGLSVGQNIAYLFDFGDEWRVRLTVAKLTPADDASYPRIVASRGEAPPQYPDYDAELDEVA